MPFFIAQGDRRAASAHARAAGAGRAARGEGRHRGVADARRPRPRRRRSRPVRTRSKDTLDVWFDSGATHQTVMGGPNGRDAAVPARIRRTPAFPPTSTSKGSDQHRGWFHSSLLVSCMLNGVPPYQGAPDARLRRRRRRPEDVEVEGQRRRAAEGLEHARRRDPAACGSRRPTTRASSSSPTRS